MAFISQSKAALNFEISLQSLVKHVKKKKRIVRQCFTWTNNNQLVEETVTEDIKIVIFLFALKTKT